MHMYLCSGSWRRTGTWCPCRSLAAVCLPFCATGETTSISPGRKENSEEAIWYFTREGYYLVGDAQTQIEGPLRREQIFARIIKVRRKGKILEPGNFWWEFFEHVWIRIIPVRRAVAWCYGKVSKLFSGQKFPPR